MTDLLTKVAATSIAAFTSLVLTAAGHFPLAIAMTIVAAVVGGLAGRSYDELTEEQRIAERVRHLR